MEYFRARLSLADAHVGKYTMAEICKSRGERWDERREYFTLMHFSRETYVCISYGANYCLVFFDISRAVLVIIRVHEKRYLIAKIAMTHKLENGIYIYIYISGEERYFESEWKTIFNDEIWYTFAEKIISPIRITRKVKIFILIMIIILIIIILFGNKIILIYNYFNWVTRGNSRKDWHSFRIVDIVLHRMFQFRISPSIRKLVVTCINSGKINA